MSQVFGDMTDEDAFDTDDLDIDAAAAVFLLILRRLKDEGHLGEVLVALAVVALIARLKREGTI